MGALPTPDGVRFRVWAPAARRVEVVLEPPASPANAPLAPEGDGLWAAHLPGLRAGARYRFRLDGQGPFPDPYSRSQPDGVHGPSEVVDPRAFTWHDAGRPGLSPEGLVIYQCHVGTATPEGTFDALAADLPRLRDLGVTAVEPLPVAEFPGMRNWGYDGVNLFAPTRAYGGPDALKRFVDAAHQHGLGVILDVVYNHLGPDGNYLRQFSPHFFTDRYHTPWGDAVNFDGPGSPWVRKFVLDNARYWIHEFHADGLRLDATHAIFDASPRHLLADLSDSVRASLPLGRPVVLIAESSENDARYLRPTHAGGFGLDAVWADDFHHSLRRFLLGDREGYYADYQGTLDEVARTITRGWLYEGQPSPRSGEPRGTPADDAPASAFVYVLQNHDQVGNRPFGDRLHHTLDLDRYRAASALLLFLPFTPMLFMGQEFAASTPFQYFTDHNPDLGRLVTEGRRKEFQAFSAFANEATRERIPDPQAADTFERSRLPLAEASREPGAGVHALYADLLRLRRADPVLADQDRHALRAQPLGEHVLEVRRWRGEQERRLVVNFGATPARVSLPGGGPWRVLLHTGPAPAALDGAGVEVPGHGAAILAGTHVDD